MNQTSMYSEIWHNYHALKILYSPIFIIKKWHVNKRYLFEELLLEYSKGFNLVNSFILMNTPYYLQTGILPEYTMGLEISNYYPEEMGSSERVSKLSKVRKCSADFIVLCCSFFDFDKADTLLGSVIKTC